MTAADAAALRPLGLWIRMLWDIALPVLPLRAEDPDGGVGPGGWPCLRPEGLWLPAAPTPLTGSARLLWQQAAVSHAAAHRVFSRASFERAGTAPITQAITGVLEDARAEALAARELPGLARLWASQHAATPDLGDGFEALLLRLARALADAGYGDPHPWIHKARRCFWRDAAQQVLAQPDPRAMHRLASELGHDLGQMRTAFNPRSYRPGPDYRDDNRWLWREAGEPQAERQRLSPVPSATDAQGVRAMAPAGPGMQDELHRHPEWDARIGLVRRDWCSVWLMAPQRLVSPAGSATGQVAGGVDTALLRRLRRALEGPAPRWQPAASGDELAMGEAVRAIVARRVGRPWDPSRTWLRRMRAPVRAAVLLLVDTSASSASLVPGAGIALAIQKRQAVALAQALTAVGWRVAVQGFDSDGRHRVAVRRVLDFGEAWDARSAARLDALAAARSTRLGAVLRQGLAQLRAQPVDRRWMLVLGDAEPHDIDTLDDRHLVADAQHALRRARAAGLGVACLVPRREDVAGASRVFGERHVAAAGSEADLPRALGRLVPGLQSL
ncbi:hypothetical protein [Pseudacidovorax sp. NFM-22]|uniref:hypothetical protein n=1 Tax=Pseudacidovorax sp. NFM-22 TaxID=2744469 RepID=UPI001F183493|nr:hypothetical protein [Pseudacidovorax sp. NFM-22]